MYSSQILESLELYNIPEIDIAALHEYFLLNIECYHSNF